jgi:RNA polymerase sigma-70 factor (ECF subfamily)
MSPETRAFLDAVRAADDPTPDDERRVLTAVRATIATGATLGAAIAVSKTAKLFSGGIASGLKLGGLLVGLGVTAWIASTTLSTRGLESPAKPAATQHAEDAQVPRVMPRAPLPRSADEAPEVARSHPATPPSPKPDAPSSTATRAGATSSAPPSLRDEIALLADVKTALDRGDGATALKRLDERPSVDRRLLAERKAARVLALCLLGRTREAEQSARAFFREHPSSVQRTAIERSCAGKTPAPR